MARFDHLPPGVVPFAVSRETAAELVGVSPNHFDKLVRDGLLPDGRDLGGRVVWASDELRAALHAVPRRGQAAPVNPWDEPA